MTPSATRSLVHGLPVLVLAALGALWLPEALSAQEARVGSLEMRHFYHVFIAYTAAWLLIFGWVVAILRRLKRVEDRLGS